MKVKGLILGIGIGLLSLGTACAQDQDFHPTQDQCFAWADFYENVAMVRDSGTLPSEETQKVADFFHTLMPKLTPDQRVNFSKEFVNQIYVQDAGETPQEIRGNYMQKCSGDAQQ